MKFYEHPTIPFTKEFKGTTPASKPRWYYTFTCTICNQTTTKVKANNFKWVCTSCAHRTASTTKFIDASKQKFPDKFDYQQTQVINTRSKVTLTCKQHGDFCTRVHDHLNSPTGGCPGCGKANQVAAVTLSLNDWSDRLISTHGNKFTITNFTNIGYHEPVVLVCKDHGEFTTTFGAITHTKFLCKYCAAQHHQKQSKRANEPFARLYYVYLPDIDMYKLGVSTYKSSSLSSAKYIMLWQKWYAYEDAIMLEHVIHTELSDYRYKGTKRLLRAGNTELYKSNVEPQILKILTRASQRELCVERILNGETPFKEDNPVLNQQFAVNAERLSLKCE